MSEILSDFSILFKYFDSPESLDIFNSEERQALLKEQKELSLSKGEIIIEEGRIPSGVFLINQGAAKLYKVGFTGKEQIIRFLKKGDLIGYRSILSGESFGATVSALEDMNVSFIPERFFIKMLKNNAKMSFEMLTLVSAQLGDAADIITVLAQKTVRERLAEILLTLEEQLGKDDEGFIRVSLTREEMANLIGTATESAIRLISEFKNDDLIQVSGRKIKLLEREKITKLAQL